MKARSSKKSLFHSAQLTLRYYASDDALTEDVGQLRLGKWKEVTEVRPPSLPAKELWTKCAPEGMADGADQTVPQFQNGERRPGAVGVEDERVPVVVDVADHVVVSAK